MKKFVEFVVMFLIKSFNIALPNINSVKEKLLKPTINGILWEDLFIPNGSFIKVIGFDDQIRLVHQGRVAFTDKPYSIFQFGLEITGHSSFHSRKQIAIMFPDIDEWINASDILNNQNFEYTQIWNLRHDKVQMESIPEFQRGEQGIRSHCVQ